jgi:two-component system, OmpR family, KDP operon response regulator KdpE
MAHKILIVDDDADLCKLLALKLETKVFDTRFAGNGKEALHLAYEFKPDLIVLDVVMPQMDGFETCKRLRELSDVPIILLTAKSEEKDVLQGFACGADDYIRKPFSRNELTARMLAQLRRRSLQDCDSVHYDDGKLSIDLHKQCVFKQGERIHLSKMEFELLSHLVCHQGRVLSHAELLSEIWGSGYKEAKSLLSLYVRYLRQKIEDDPHNPEYIRTEWGIGYRFAPLESEGVIEGDPQQSPGKGKRAHTN